MHAHVGMIGLGTMGRNLLLNIADHGFETCGYDRDPAQQARMREEAGSRPMQVAASLPAFVQALESPRIIILLVPAGKIVDAVISELLPLVEKGDIIIDGGNSHFADTERRYRQLQDSGIHFIGMGVSGGEEGARKGPSLMPGGNQESYNRVQPVLEAIAARTAEGPCVSFIGKTAAGHFTKMVHNGIEYAIMQLISEVYGILKNAGSYTNQDLYQVFDRWNKSELESFLVEITAEVFLKKDEETGQDLVDLVLDKAKQKGTGQWTTQAAMDLQVPIPLIDTAVTMRYLSARKEQRVANDSLYGLRPGEADVAKERLEQLARSALHFGSLLAYAQGLELLSVASAQYNYGIRIADVVRVWKGGCIIRSRMLEDLGRAYADQPDLSNPIASALFRSILLPLRSDLANLVNLAIHQRQSAACLCAALQYFDAYTTARLPANLIQAQRDFFGAHTYERTDKAGIFHSNWETGTGKSQ